MLSIEKAIERFTHFLKLRGLSVTRERKEILEAVINMSRRFTVDDLFFAMHSEDKKTSKATIYRTIQLLVECRIIRESDLSGRQAAYEPTEPGHHIGHMVCEHCGAVVEFKGPTLEKFIHQASVNNQFLPLSAAIKFSGFCNECVKANPPSLRRDVCVPFLKYAQSRGEV